MLLFNNQNFNSFLKIKYYYLDYLRLLNLPIESLKKRILKKYVIYL